MYRVMSLPSFVKAMLPHNWGAVTKNLPKSFCFGGGGFDEVKDRGGCIAKQCGRGG